MKQPQKRYDTKPYTLAELHALQAQMVRDGFPFPKELDSKLVELQLEIPETPRLPEPEENSGPVIVDLGDEPA